MPNPYLEWLDENQQVQRLKLGERTCIGRTCKGIDPQGRITLKDPRVSRNHVEIIWTAGRLQIVDTSTNGTWVNDVRMAAGSSKDLSDGDSIRIGDSLFQVVYPSAAADFKRDDTLTQVTMTSPVAQVVTTLVADVRGFSAYSQKHSSIEAYDIIKEIFNQFTKIVEAFNGTIKDFAGDAIFAFWEHRFKDATTQAISACQTAHGQVQQFSVLQTALSDKYADVTKLRMGWGIATGPIILSHFGSRSADLALVGDCVNLASRLSGMANKEIPESILICTKTAALVESRCTLEDLGLHAIQGLEGKKRIHVLRDA